jgi:hypothetical protein
LQIIWAERRHLKLFLQRLFVALIPFMFMIFPMMIVLGMYPGTFLGMAFFLLWIGQFAWLARHWADLTFAYNTFFVITPRRVLVCNWRMYNPTKTLPPSVHITTNMGEIRSSSLKIAHHNFFAFDGGHRVKFHATSDGKLSRRQWEGVNDPECFVVSAAAAANPTPLPPHPLCFAHVEAQQTIRDQIRARA